MKAKNTQELSIQETPVQSMMKWTSPKIVTLNSEKSEAGVFAGPEGSHTPFSTNLGS